MPRIFSTSAAGAAAELVHHGNETHPLQPVEGHPVGKLVHQLRGNAADEIVAPGAAAGVVDFHEPVQTEPYGRHGRPALAGLAQYPEQNALAGEVGNGIHHEILVLMRDAAREKKRSTLVFAPLHQAAAADPDIAPARRAHAVAQIMEGSLLTEHGIQLLPVTLPFPAGGDALGPVLQKAGNNVAAEAELVTHVVGNIEYVLLHIAEEEITRRILHGDGVEEHFKVAAGGVHELIERTLRVPSALGRHKIPALPAAHAVIERIIDPLVVIHHAVGLRDQLLHAQGTPVRPGIAHRNVMSSLPDALLQTGHALQKILFAHVLKHGHELVAAAAENIGNAQRAVNELVALADELVAPLVPHDVVDVLEARNVAEDHAERTSLPRPAVQLEQRVAVEGSRERIAEAHGAQALQKIAPSEQRHHEVAYHLEKRRYEIQLVPIGIVHADEADDAVFHADGPGRQRMHALRLQNGVRGGIRRAYLLDVLDDDGLFLGKEIQPPLQTGNGHIAQNVLLRLYALFAPLVGVGGQRVTDLKNVRAVAAERFAYIGQNRLQRFVGIHGGNYLLQTFINDNFIFCIHIAFFRYRVVIDINSYFYSVISIIINKF